MKVTGRQLLSLLAGVLIASGVCCFAASDARASVLVPESLAQLIGDFELDAATSSAAENSPLAPADQPVPGDRDDSVRFLVPGLPADGPASGTSTSASTGLGAVGAGSAVLHAAASLSDPDQSLTTWLQGDARFALPIPPGNDLLRPPQG